MKEYQILVKLKAKSKEEAIEKVVDLNKNEELIHIEIYEDWS